MGQIVTNLASLALLVFLFAAITRRAADDRLRCWVAGWVGILIHIGLKLWQPHGSIAQFANVCASIDSLAVTAIFFIVSTMIVREGRKRGLLMAVVLTLFTLPCLTVAIAHPRPGWVLPLLVIVRQIVAGTLAMRPRVNHRFVASVLISIHSAALVWMLYALSQHHAEVVVLALLGEMYVVAAVDFWLNGWLRTLGLATTCIGLGAFGAVLPCTLLIAKMWPGSSYASALLGVCSFGAAVGMILIVLEEDARAARQTTEEYRLTFDTNPHPLWVVDTETLEFLAVNQAACTKHGYTPEEFSRLRLPDVLEKSTVTKVVGEIAARVPRPNRASLHIRKDGSQLPMDITAHDIIFRGRHARFVLGIDVSERERLQQQVQHHSEHDILTGLPNRVLFEEQLKSSMTRAIDANEKLAIICINLDRFKRINDTYGTGTGDECLKQIAEILQAHAEPRDLVARTGGDEFALVLTGIKSDYSAEEVLMDLRDAFLEAIVAGETKVRLSFSAGLALCPDDGVEGGALWRRAEIALSKARAAGGAQVVWTSPDLHIAAEQQVELERFMRTQLEHGGFHLAYQPIFTMDGHVEGFEALLRLTHPVYGPISPGRFIPLAEETGLIIPLGDWVIEEVCRQLHIWHDQGLRAVPVAVNVSGLQLVQRGFAERVIRTMSRCGVSPEQIVLEVTESTAMLNEAEVTGQMMRLSEFGIRFSIDDFGTGHSSLNRLDKLPLRTLKIDQTFTARLCAVDGTRSIVQAIISMAQALQMNIVAEGVEQKEQMLSLHEMGCDYLQGFLFSRPVPPSAVPGLLQHRNPILAELSSPIAPRQQRSA